MTLIGYHINNLKEENFMKDITITSLETITAFDVVTGAYKFTLDELQNATLSQSQESQEIVGKQGRKLNSLKRNKAVTVSAANGLVSGGLLELQTGCDFKNEATEVMWVDYLTVEDGEAETTFKAVGTTGAEIVELFVRNADGTEGAKLTQDATASTGKFAYAPATKTLSLPSALTDGTEIVVYYKRKIVADVLENSSDVYSGKAMLYIDAIGEDVCANVYRVQIFIPKADVSGEWSFEMGDNQTIHNFDAEALAGSCTSGKNFFTYTVFGANTEDAE